MIVLFTTYYRDKNKQRAKEIDKCLKLNVNNPMFSQVVVFVEHDDLPVPYYRENTTIAMVKYRPYYSDIIRVANHLMADFSIICNSDIYFDDSLSKIRSMAKDEVYALSRWDCQKDGTVKLLNQKDSQDTWIFRGKISEQLRCDFSMGKAGCDNRLAFELMQAGYRVSNPSHSIVTHHLHNSNVRNYNIHNVKDRVQPPYAMVEPSSLETKKQAIYH